MASSDPRNQSKGSSSSGPKSTAIDGEAARNDYENEISLPDPYFNVDFQKSLKYGFNLIKTMLQCLRESVISETNPRLRVLRQDFEDLSRFDTSVTRTIAIGGNSGSSKCFPKTMKSTNIRLKGKAVPLIHCWTVTLPLR